jgi:eukaryotic-like serine/threonine-protein kinase
MARSLNNLAFVRQVRGEFQDAEKLYREAVSIAEEQGDADRAIYLRNLAAVLVAQGQPVEAEARVREALAIFRAEEPPTWRVADAESVLGSCLTAMGRFNEAEPLLVRSYRVLEKDPGDGAKYAPEAMKRIRELYATMGKPDRAVPLLSLP